ncbi:autotransporter domain-containing protein [Phenylobacterium sp.]|jgi:hypothetical protein|uniref:autotransporter family protein n=1 Tax=Phenylobacterium sp. TaxID=1871053 RepID=UPI002F417990
MTGYFSPAAAPNRPGEALPRRGFAGLLKFGPALVSASALLWAGAAQAQAATSTTVTSTTTTPLATSTSGDITINAGVTVKPAPPNTTAVTLDAPTGSLINNGTIFFQNQSNVTGVHAIVPATGIVGSIDNTGSIEVDDTSQPTTDSNGITHGPFANGSNRIGIQVTGPGLFTSDISNDATGTITIKGDNSYAISVESALSGTLSNLGSITVSGTNAIGIRTLGNASISSSVTLGGTILAQGQNAQVANLAGDINSNLEINGTLTSTGYRFTTRSTDTNFLKNLTADDLLQGGATVTVGGNVTGGILVDEVSTTDTTGAISVAEGALSSISSAPALVVGNATRNITIGNVGVDPDAFGIEIKGAVTGQGVYDGITSTGMQIGLPGSGFTVNTTGGVHISGTVSASAYAASATGLEMNGVIAQVFRNDGAVTASMNSDAAGASATAVSISAGSNVAAMQNANTIVSSVVGQQGNAVGLVDHSGSLVEVENIGIISTGRTLSTGVTTGASGANGITGQNIALDLSANTTGVHILQDAPSGDTASPTIAGAVLLGSGGDRVEITAGAVTGNVNLGSGANSLTIDNGAVVKGNLDATTPGLPDGTVALNVANGTLQINDASQLKLPSLNLGATSTLVVTADPATGLATSMAVSGPASIASGAKIGVRLASILPGSATYTLISSPQLTAGALDSNLLGDTPFLYNTTLQTSLAAGTVDATLTRKTAAQLGLPAATAAAYEPLIANIGKDTGLEGALLAQTTRGGLITLYNQLMPNHSASIFNTIAASVSSFSKPLDDRQDPVGGGFWMQETNAGLFQRTHDDDPGYKAWSFGAVAGYEIPRTPLGILGATFGASTNEIFPDELDAAADLHANMVDAGVYWRMTKGGFSANVRFGADYVKVSSTRVIDVLGGDGLAVSRTANGEWSALGFNAHAMASYERHFGRYYLRPQANLDYIHLAEGSYSETGGGDAMDLAVASRTSSRLSAFAGVAVGALYGPDRSWGPEATLGYRTVANENLGVTNARFIAGGDPFALRSEEISGSGAAAHFSLRGENGSGGFALEAGAENRDNLSIYDLRLSGHVQF